MNFSEYLSPLGRQKTKFIIIFLILGGLFWQIITLIPAKEKITLYFSVKPTVSEEIPENLSLDPIESSMKVAEGIAGWAKNPAFRNEILQQADVYIPHFKRKITAKKQNRINVFWTIKLNENESNFSDKIKNALIQTIEKYFNEWNTNHAFPFAITTPTTASELQTFPLSWRIAAVMITSLLLTIFILYIHEALTKKIAFPSEVKKIFPDSPTLVIPEKVGKHDSQLLEQFLSTFEKPILISTFSVGEKAFPVSSLEDSINGESVSILLVQLGQTTITELENIKAIIGEEVGIIVFEK